MSDMSLTAVLRRIGRSSITVHGYLVNFALAVRRSQSTIRFCVRFAQAAGLGWGHIRPRRPDREAQGNRAGWVYHSGKVPTRASVAPARRCRAAWSCLRHYEEVARIMTLP